MASFNSCSADALVDGVSLDDCTTFLRNECQKEENAFSANCNQFLIGTGRFFADTVIKAYDTRVKEWLNGNRGSWFGRRGWEPHHTGRDEHNIVDVCNRMPSSSNEMNYCDDWFRQQCGSQAVNVQDFPWCACMKDQGYDMNYYDPQGEVMDNENITGVGAGWGIDDPLPDNPYCFVKQCRDDPRAYKGRDNRRGNHQCPICINVFDDVNTIFLNFTLTQVCKGSDIPGHPGGLVGDPSDDSKWYENGVVLGSVIAFALILFLLLFRAISRGRARIKDAQDESLIAALAIAGR